MKVNIISLLFIALLGITVSASIAQQDQNSPKTDTEVEKLKNRVTELEGKLQTVENVEKMELAAKLAEAQAKLIDTEFGKLKLELKDSNQQWLRNWIFLILGILSLVGFALWKWLTKKMDEMIAVEVEGRINRFEEAVEKANILEPQVRILNKEHAASVLERYRSFRPEHFPEEVKELEEQAILDVFSDETRHLEYRMKAAEVLANRNSTELVFPVLKCLSSYVESDFEWEQHYQTQHLLCNLIHLIRYAHSSEIYETFKKSLDRLLTEAPEVKRFIITSMAFSLVNVSNELNKKDSVSTIRKAIPHLDIRSRDEEALKYLVEYFDKFAEPEGIKEIYIIHAKGKMPDVEEKCLDLLEKYDPDFVKKEREEKASTNTEGEETDESEPTE